MTRPPTKNFMIESTEEEELAFQDDCLNDPGAVNLTIEDEPPRP